MWGLLVCFRISQQYLLLYFIFIWITFVLIKEISRVNNLGKKITKWDFFTFTSKYFFIATLYIILFGLIYSTTYNLNYGDFSFDGKIYLIGLKESLFISGMTFLSYDVGLFPNGFMKLFLFFQMFISQIMILGFLFIIFSELLTRIKQKDLKKFKLNDIK